MDHRSEPTPFGAIKSLDELRNLNRSVYHTFPLNKNIMKYPPPESISPECYPEPKSVEIKWTNGENYSYWFNAQDRAPFAPFGDGNGWIFTNYWHAWAYCQRKGYKE